MIYFTLQDASKRGRFNLNQSRHGSLHYERTPTVTFSEETGNNRLQPLNGKLLYRTISHEDNMSKKKQGDLCMILTNSFLVGP